MEESTNSAAVAPSTPPSHVALLKPPLSPLPKQPQQGGTSTTANHRVINIPTVTTPSSPSNISELSSHNSRSHRTPTAKSSNHANHKKPLNARQQAAMNTFLSAQTKEEKARAWDDLVKSLKSSSGGGSSVNSRKKSARGGSSGSVGSSGSNHSLGFIQFNPRPGGGMSVTSGLTSTSGNNNDIKEYLSSKRAERGYNYNNHNNLEVMMSPTGSNSLGDTRPPLFPNNGNSNKVVGGEVEELVSPLSEGYYEDEEEEGVEKLMEEGEEEELEVFVDEESEEEEGLNGEILEEEGEQMMLTVPPPPPPSTDTTMPKLQPNKRDNSGHSVRDIIDQIEKEYVGEVVKESESWSPSMIRRKSDQLFAREDNRSTSTQEKQKILQREQIQLYTEWEEQDESNFGGQDENQCYSEWGYKEPVESKPTTAAAAAAAAVTAAVVTPKKAAVKETPPQRTRKPKNKSSLEDQIRLVLGNNYNQESDTAATKNKDASSVTSASDILRELSDSKQQMSSPQPLRSSPSINRLPPTRISFFEGTTSKQPLQQEGEAKLQKQRISKQSNSAKKTPALLAPSRRDLHSLRIRQMVSESTISNDTNVGGNTQVKNATTATSIATTPTTTTATTTTRDSPVRPVRGAGKGFFTRTGPSINPPVSGLYSSEMITKDDTSTFDLYPGLNSSNYNNSRSTPQQQQLYTSPPRTKAPTPPSSTSSPTHSLADSINELKASISELKNAGVGGVGKATSTLVWNESTGRYVIADLDDESFHDVVSLGPSVEGEEEERGGSEVFHRSHQIGRGNIRDDDDDDDDVVDEAVRLAAMDGMSTSDESLDNFMSPGEEEEEEEDFFVVERSRQNVVDNKWRGFQQSSDEFQVNAWGDYKSNDDDDGFDDGFGDDASFPSEIQWGATDWTDWQDGDNGKHFEKMNFVSPTSVSGSNRQDPFNPFAQLVLQSLD